MKSICFRATPSASASMVASSQAHSDMSIRLIHELRESHPYLKDGGWHNVARLMLAAADELERLNDRILELESRTATEPGGPHR